MKRHQPSYWKHKQLDLFYGMQKYIITGFLILLLTGCVPIYQADQLDNASMKKLNRTASVYIAMPKDGRFSDRIYHGSGYDTASILRGAFSQYVSNVKMGAHYQDKKAALRYAKTKQYNYLIYPIIFNWEPRATAWSGRPNRMTMQLSVINIKNRRVLDSVMLDGASGTFTNFADTPYDLLKQSVSNYVAKLYG